MSISLRLDCEIVAGQRRELLNFREIWCLARRGGIRSWGRYRGEMRLRKGRFPGYHAAESRIAFGCSGVASSGGKNAVHDGFMIASRISHVYTKNAY
jgi:hypothetical protein